MDHGICKLDLPPAKILSIESCLCSQFTDGKTYFFKGKLFWAFDDIRMAVEADAPRHIGQHWMHCPRDIRTSIGTPPELTRLR